MSGELENFEIASISSQFDVNNGLNKSTIALSKVLYATLSFLIVLLAVVSARYTGYGQESRIVGSIFQPEPDPTVFRPTHEGAQFSELTAMELLNDVGDHME